jgi:CheY-like chemotaxis protein
VQIAVADNGIGIDPAMLPHVFDLFSQAPDARPMRQGGIGIGLAIARRLVEMHGGALLAHSAGLGHGSTFSIRLPLAQAGAAPAHTDRIAPARTRGNDGGGRRILILDDNVDAAQTLGALLGLAGHTVTLAHTGQQAIDLARQENVEIAFLDIGLPDMTGYDVARALRAQPGGHALRLVALTGWGAATDRSKSVEAGIDRHLTKPVTMQALAEALPDLALPEDAGA